MGDHPRTKSHSNLWTSDQRVAGSNPSGRARTTKRGLILSRPGSPRCRRWPDMTRSPQRGRSAARRAKHSGAGEREDHWPWVTANRLRERLGRVVLADIDGRNLRVVEQAPWRRHRAHCPLRERQRARPWGVENHDSRSKWRQGSRDPRRASPAPRPPPNLGPTPLPGPRPGAPRSGQLTDPARPLGRLPRHPGDPSPWASQARETARRPSGACSGRRASVQPHAVADPRSATSGSDAPDLCHPRQLRPAPSRARPRDPARRSPGPSAGQSSRCPPPGPARRPCPRVPRTRRVIESGFSTPTRKTAPAALGTTGLARHRRRAESHPRGPSLADRCTRVIPAGHGLRRRLGGALPALAEPTPIAMKRQIETTGDVSSGDVTG